MRAAVFSLYSVCFKVGFFCTASTLSTQKYSVFSVECKGLSHNTPLQLFHAVQLDVNRDFLSLGFIKLVVASFTMIEIINSIKLGLVSCLTTLSYNPESGTLCKA